MTDFKELERRVLDKLEKKDVCDPRLVDGIFGAYSEPVKQLLLQVRSDYVECAVKAIAEYEKMKDRD